MADNTNSDNGSRERVALDLMATILKMGHGFADKPTTDDLLGLYAKCRKATYGMTQT